MAVQKGQNAIHIDARDGERPVLLHPDNDDLFVRTGRQVIEACRLGISIELWLSEFNAMLEEARHWAEQRAAKVRACFCAPVNSRVVLYFVPNSKSFDFDLADGLAELNAELVKRFNVGMVEIHQVPWEELDRFVDIESSRRVYGEQRESGSGRIIANFLPQLQLLTRIGL